MEASDHELAMLLQLEYDTEINLKPDNKEDSFDNKTLIDLEKSLPHGFTLPETPPRKKNYSQSPVKSHKSKSEKVSIIDPSWELLDPVPDIHALFLQYNADFFWGKLAAAEVRWSPRMTLCAGLCVYERRGGFCSIRLSAPLLKLRPRKDLVETLIHEMIHAFLFLTHNNKDHDDHGPEFKKHMHRINDQEGTNISVYHNFHDEVNSYRQHWWRCDGPCKDRKPFYGWVKRSMNRAPSARDTWWAQHKQTCGGNYVKVKEPDGYKKKGEKKNKDKNEPSTSTNGNTKPKPKPPPEQGNDIRNFLKNDQKSNFVDLTGGAPSYREKQATSAKIIDNIGKGLGSKGNIKSATNFLNLTEKSDVGDGVGKDGNIHSVGKFLKGESTSGATSSVTSFAGSGSKLGGSASGRPASGCQASRLLNMFGQNSGKVGESSRKSGPNSIHGKLGHNSGQVGLHSEKDGQIPTEKGRKRLSSDDLSTDNVKKPKSDNPSQKTNPKPGISKLVGASSSSVKTEGEPGNLKDYFTSPDRYKGATSNSQGGASNNHEPVEVECPACCKKVAYSSINDHLNQCLS